MRRTGALLLAFLTVLSVFAGGTVTAQEDVVTLTVSVETPSGDPVGGADVTATWDGGSTSATTVSDGRALMDVPEGADLELTLEHDDYVRNFPATVEDASAREVSMTAYPKATARITVTDRSGVVADATVRLNKNGANVVEETTDGGGVVTSGTIEAGEYAVIVSKAGYFVSREEVDVSGDAAIEVSIERGTVTLEVNVTDDHFEQPQPVGEAIVEVEGSGSVVTQPGGIGRISVPVNAWARLSVTKEGYETTEEAVFVREEDTEVAIAIQRTPAISAELLSRRVVIGERVALTVTDEYGDPVAGAVVRLDGEEVAQTDEDGQAIIEVPDAGEHEVTVRSGSLEAEPQTVVGVSEGEAAGGDTEADDSSDTESTGEETEAELPGFGALAALLALAFLVGVGALRRSNRR